MLLWFWQLLLILPLTIWQLLLLGWEQHTTKLHELSCTCCCRSSLLLQHHATPAHRKQDHTFNDLCTHHHIANRRVASALVATSCSAHC